MCRKIEELQKKNYKENFEKNKNYKENFEKNKNYKENFEKKKLQRKFRKFFFQKMLKFSRNFMLEIFFVICFL